MARKRPLTELKEEIAATSTEELVQAAFILRDPGTDLPARTIKLVYVIRELRGRLNKEAFNTFIEDVSRINTWEAQEMVDL